MPSGYAIGKHFDNFIRGRLEGGRYSSASEVIRENDRLLVHRKIWLHLCLFRPSFLLYR
jgi:putative addiction module CopG family antidote